MRQVPRRRKMASNVTWADSESRDSAWVQRCIIYSYSFFFGGPSLAISACISLILIGLEPRAKTFGSLQPWMKRRL